MSDTRVFKSALGISTGDVVTTSYATSPYEVWSIYGPNFVTRMIGGLFIRDFPVISLTLIEPGGPASRHTDFFFINDIHQEGDRWITGTGDELFVEKKPAGGIQRDLFTAVSQSEPYTFDPAVDYHGDIPAWHCPGCKRDFNAPYRKPAPHAYPPMCPMCNMAADRIFIEFRTEARR